MRELYPDGVDAALDLVGTPTLPDTLRAVRVRGTACFSGSVSGQWTVRDFSPNEYLPKGVRLAGYSGDAADLPREAFQEILDTVAAGRLAFPVDRVYDGLEQVRQAHDNMEHDRATGKLVVRIRHKYVNYAWQTTPGGTGKLGVRAPVARHLTLGIATPRRVPQDP